MKKTDLLSSEQFFSDSMFEKNRILIVGEMLHHLEFQEKRDDETFYRGSVVIKRESNYDDEIEIIVSENLLCGGVKSFNRRAIDEKILIAGQLRSRRWVDENGYHLNVFIMVTTIKFVKPTTSDENIVFLEGRIVKSTYRKTPGGREITDVILELKNVYGQYYKIPCVVWGRNALYVKKLGINRKLQVYGRIQSREYLKKLLNCEETECRITYEVSVQHLKVCD